MPKKYDNVLDNFRYPVNEKFTLKEQVIEGNHRDLIEISLFAESCVKNSLSRHIS